jgi:hypothetical protein
VSCATSAPLVEFGDDRSEWANDGECDDPRFSGSGSAETLLDEDAYHDATDCRTLYQSGQIQLSNGDAGVAAVAPAIGLAGDIDFGGDASEWANNGECDDPRFRGAGSARKLVQADRFNDATDCSTLYERGDIQLNDGESGRRDGSARITIDGIDFGDDDGSYVFDDECDDPRFIGDGAAEVLAEPDRFHDATDCAVLYQSGRVQLADDASTPTVAVQSGTPQRGQLAGNGHVDYYSYQGTADTVVVFDLKSPAFDTYLTVVTPSGERLSNDDYQDSQERSLLTLPLSETGEYQVEVASYDSTQTGAYTLALNEIAVVADNEYEGSLDSGDDTADKGEYVDTYTFEGQSGQSVNIELSSDDFDTYLVLRTPDGKIETNDDDDGNSSGSRIESELSVSGTYTVRVTSYSAGETGAYQLRILQSE